MATPKGNPYDGVLVIDKPVGMTSHDVISRVRRAANQKKVGHAGTLDPDATGVLVVALGRATRLVPYLQAGRKTYDARMRLGATTSTLDAAGEVLTTTDASGVDEPHLCEALKRFVGEIDQIPPMVSAVKIDGERLYAKARRGEEVDRPARRVTIHDIVLEDFVAGPQAEAEFLVTCSAGTYIRSLAADVGDVLGVGAHLIALRRLASGSFSVEQAIDLDTLAELGERGALSEALLSPGAAVSDYDTRIATQDEVTATSFGQALEPTGRTGPIALLDEQGTLLAMIEDRDGRARHLVVLAPAGAQ